jgi:hypothetical protein
LPQYDIIKRVGTKKKKETCYVNPRQPAKPTTRVMDSNKILFLFLLYDKKNIKINLLST